ncbi:MAG: hypothetical protein RSD67_08390 [Oscillospiraceae bacterium]
MDNAKALALEIKRRNNIKIISPQIGEVMSISPLSIAIQQGNIIITKPNIFLCNAIKDSLKVADLVACIPIEKKFIIIDKVV